MLKRVGHLPATQTESMKAVQGTITSIKMRDEVLNPKLQLRRVKTTFSIRLEICSVIKNRSQL